MSNYREIVTKAIIGKSKKNSIDSFSIETEEVCNTVLGCWVINHTFSGVSNNGKVVVNGEYDVNVWYSYDSDTKTTVSKKRYSYSDVINVNLKDNTALTNNNEIIVRSLQNPNVIDVDVVDGKVNVNVSKELAVEVIGDTKIKVSIEDLVDDYEEVSDSDLTDEVLDNIEEDYLK